MPNASIESRGSLGSRLLTLALAALVGIASLALVLRLQNAGLKTWVIVLGAALFPVVLAVVGHLKEILIFGWVFALTYNRQYFAFESIVGYNGTQGPYLIVADICLFGLFAWWLYERLLHRPAQPVRSAPFWPWYIPLVTIFFLSVFVAARPDWALYEMIRIAKIGLIVFYIRHNFGRREWYVSLAGLATAASFQSAIALKEIITGKPGLFHASQVAADAPDFVQHFAEGAFTGSMTRGIGTMAHPPYLAC